MKQLHKAILIQLGIGAAITALAMAMNSSGDTSFVHRLCDGLFVAAVMLLGTGGLKWARNQGAFDMMSYGMQSALHMFFPFSQGHSPLDSGNEDFVAYQQRKREERKAPTDLLIAGAVYLVLSCLALAAYMLIEGA